MQKCKEPVTKENSQEKTMFWGRRGRKTSLRPCNNLCGWCQFEASCESEGLHTAGIKKRKLSFFPSPRALLPV